MATDAASISASLSAPAERPNGDRTTANGDSPGLVQSVDRALSILEVLARDGEAGVTDIAADLGVSRSEVVIAWLTSGTPAITPIIGVSTPTYLETALKGANLELTPEQRAQLDKVW